MRWLANGKKGGQDGYLVTNVGIGGKGDVVGVGAREVVDEIRIRSRHDGVRHPRRGPRRHRDTCDHGFPAEARRALERDRGGHQRTISERLGSCGQSTVEFAVIMAGFLSITAALAALWHVLDDGLLVDHALAVASHHIQAVAPAAVADIFLY